jgi:phosphoadenosine phosphosulfate reductase
MAGVRLSDDELAQANQQLYDQPPEVILAWAVRTFHPKLVMATAFGAEGCCILHMLAGITPLPRIINLDTGYQFPETLELRERIRERYGIEVEYVRPELDVPEYEAKHGGPLYVLNPRQCCHDRKIVPLRRAVAGYDAWISAIRRDQTGTPSSAS